jgi:hypothetical protein
VRARLAALLASTLSTGCVLLPILGGPPPREDGPPLAAALDLEDLRGIVHCHSLLSHDCSGEFESIADAAAETSCSFVALCDHLRGREKILDEPDGRVNGVLLIPGAELNMNGGSLLSIGAAAGIDRKLEDAALVADVRAHGGIAAIGHPEEVRLEHLVDVDGCELENVHAAVTAENKLTLGLRVIFYPPRPFFSSILERQPRAAAVYDALAREHPLAAIGACDAHEAIRPLGPLAGAVDSYRRLFRTATTHILTPPGAALTKADVLSAMKQGRTYGASELTQDATGFSFVARSGETIVATLGGSASIASGVVLEARLPAAGGITILRDGADTVVVKEGTSARWAPVVPGAYRVEATYDGKPWIWSSAIRVVR